MKNWGLVLGLFLTALLGLSACSKGGDSSSGGGGGTTTIATTPCNSPSGGSCDTSFYNNVTNVSIPRDQAYTYTYGGSYCGCSLGSRPIYNNSWGFACVPDSYMTSSLYVGYNYMTLLNSNSYAYQSQNTLPLNTSQVYYQSTVSNAGNSCYSSFAMSCDVRAANTCNNGGVCQAIGGSSAVGVCVNSNNGSSYYNGGYYNSYPSNYGYGGYYGGGYNYSGGGNSRCSYRQNSWGLWYSYCY